MDTPVEQVEPVVEQPSVGFTEIEQKAMAKGWKPLDQWKGDPAEFIDPEQFLKNHTWVKQIKKQNEQLTQQAKAIEYLVEQNKRTEALTRQKVLEELQQAQQQAASVGDTAAVSAYTDKIIEARVGLDRLAESEVLAKQAVDKFLETNGTWFHSDPHLREFAINHDAMIKRAFPEMSSAERLRKVEQDVKTFFAHKFVPETKPIAAVEASTPRVTKTREYTISELPKADQTLARYLKATLSTFNEQEYVKDYFDSMKGVR